MKKFKLFLILITLSLSCVTGNKEEPPVKNNFETGKENVVHLNSLGFLPDQQKEATLTVEAKTFRLRRAEDHEIVYQGETTGPYRQDDLKQTAWIADFSDFTLPGKYYIELNEESRSIVFPIGEKIYEEPFSTVMNGFYLWRCGASVFAEHLGEKYSHNKCHLGDGFGDYIGYPGMQFDGRGGWHDAGDYGKYTVNAGITMGVLFFAWEHFQKKIESSPFSIPGEEAGDLPDFLRELKWEMDWLLKMPYPDGSGRVSHKLTRTNFSPFIMPEEDHEQRYFSEWSSAATASFTAVAAQAARIFAPYDHEYADSCLSVARLSYELLAACPEEKPFEQGDFKTGGYQTGDRDDRLWAAAELWQTTGETRFLKDFEQMAANIGYHSDENWDWSNLANLGLFTYALSSRSGKDSNTMSAIQESIIDTAKSITGKSEANLYRRPLEGYYWGCNGTVARQTLNLFAADKLQPCPTYRETALNAIAHLFGRNYYNRSFITGLGHNPPMHPHDRRSGADNVEAPWPGYLVGGGHSATDWVDKEDDYARNEIAINWQAPLVFALAWMLN